MYKINIIGLATGKRHTVIYGKKKQQNTLSSRFQLIFIAVVCPFGLVEVSKIFKCRKSSDLIFEKPNCHKWGNILKVSQIERRKNR